MQQSPTCCICALVEAGGTSGAQFLVIFAVQEAAGTSRSQFLVILGGRQALFVASRQLEMQQGHTCCICALEEVGGTSGAQVLVIFCGAGGIRNLQVAVLVILGGRQALFCRR